MSVKIPAPPVFTNNKNPYLTPQILVEVTLEDLTSTVSTPIGLPAIIKYNRIANIDMHLLYIPQPTLESTLNKVFDNIRNSISNDLNPEDATGTTPLPIDSEGVSTPQMQFAVQVDNTQEVKTVTVWMQIKNLKVEFVEQFFLRMKGYVLNAVVDIYR